MTTRQRSSSRPHDGLREISFRTGIAPQASGSVLVSFGRTQVLCAASIEEGVPRWMKEQGVTGGWLTAEYSMLPYSTSPRKARDSSRGKIDGRSTEIQRLIGRSLRAGIDMEAHAKYLQANAGASLILQGNADDTGTREYNLSLGQRRAVAVKKVLNLLGVQDKQIETVSYGEEKANLSCKDDACKQQDRRVDIVYVGE